MNKNVRPAPNLVLVRESKGLAHLFLPVLVVIAAIVGLLYYSWQKGIIKTISQPEISSTPSTAGEITNWKTYINNNYSFQLSFPQHLIANHDQNEELYYDNLVEILFESQQISILAISNVDIYQKMKPEVVAKRELSDSSFEYKIIPKIIANSEAALVKTESEGYFAAFISHPFKENVFIQVSSNLGSDTFNQTLSSFQFLPTQSDRNTYNNSKYGFEIKYPDDFFSTESTESYLPPFEFKVEFAENQYQDNESNYPDVSVVIIKSVLSPTDFLQENGSTASVTEERKDTRDYLYYGVSRQKQIQVNNLSALQFESQTVSTRTVHTMFRNENYIIDVTNRTTGVGEISQEIYNQILATFRFLKD